MLSKTIHGARVVAALSPTRLQVAMISFQVEVK